MFHIVHEKIFQYLDSQKVCLIDSDVQYANIEA